MDAARSDIYRAARGFLDTPFSLQGRTRSGIDCIGLVVCVGAELGLSYKDGRPIAARDYIGQACAIGDQIRQECARIFEEKSRDAIDAGDIVTLNMGISFGHHLAIVSELQGRRGLIHAYQTVRRTRGNLRFGRVVEHLLDRVWLEKIDGVFSFSGIQGS